MAPFSARHASAVMLFLVAGLLVLVGFGLWSAENSRVRKHNNGVDAEASAGSISIFGADYTGFSEAKTNHVPSVIVWGVSGTAAIVGGVLLLVHQGEPPPPSGFRDVTDQTFT